MCKHGLVVKNTTSLPLYPVVMKWIEMVEKAAKELFERKKPDV